jgi:hypothetical protein
MNDFTFTASSGLPALPDRSILFVVWIIPNILNFSFITAHWIRASSWGVKLDDAHSGGDWPANWRWHSIITSGDKKQIWFKVLECEVKYTEIVAGLLIVLDWKQLIAVGSSRMPKPDALQKRIQEG